MQEPLGVRTNHTQTIAMFAYQKQKNLKSLGSWEEGRVQQRLERDALRGSEMCQVCAGQRFLSLYSPKPHIVNDKLALWKIRPRWSTEQLWSRLGATTQQLRTLRIESYRAHQGLCHTAAFSRTCPSLCVSVLKQKWKGFSDKQPLSTPPFSHLGASVMGQAILPKDRAVWHS